MLFMKKINLFFGTSIIVALFVLLQSCGKTPVVCFEVVTPADSIRVGKDVTFNASCSIDVKEYYWSFGNGKSAIGDFVVTTTYDSVGTYEVSLLTTNGNKQNNQTKSIVVKP
jgi:PKD repeat protein